MPVTRWTIKHYNVDGGPISAADFEGNVSNTIRHAKDRSLSFFLNGVDALSFSLLLNDPMAYQVKRLRSIVKCWRTIYNDAGGVVYSDPGNAPCFAGVVASHTKQGSTNSMSVTAYNPYWRLQSRFHLLNHYLKTDILTGQDYKQSALAWKLIDLVNNAFGLSNSNTGIAKGTFYWGGEPTVAPYFVAKGTNTWANVFEDIMNKAAGFDIIPRYFHSDGNPTLIYFDTAQKRGTDKSGSVQFKYHNGADSNLDDLTELEEANPDQFGNYVWAVGHGGPNSGKVTMRQNNSGAYGSDGYQEIGIYMRRKDFGSQKELGNPDPEVRSGLYGLVDAEYEQARVPQTAYTCQLSPAVINHYKYTFDVGDVVGLSANKGALQVSGIKQRIYEAQLSNSENNMETTQLTIAKDFYSKVAT